MVRTSTYAIALLGSVVAMTAAQRTQEELDKYNEVATCVVSQQIPRYISNMIGKTKTNGIVYEPVH